MFRAFMAAYPWDLLDEGVEDVVGRLHGEVGVTGLSLWAAVPPIEQVRVRNVEPRVFRTGGGLCCQPRDAVYGATRCKPAAADWVRDRRGGKGVPALRSIAEACARCGLELRLIISATAGRPAGADAPYVCKNAFGAPSQLTFCLANPDVQAYLTALVGDLVSSVSPAGIVLADFTPGWGEALRPDRFVNPSPWPAALSPLLSICLCESCRQKATQAGVAVPVAEELIRNRAEGLLNKSAPAAIDFAALVAEHESLAAYLRSQSEELTALLRRLAETCDVELLLVRESPLPSLVRKADPTALPQHAEPNADAALPLRPLDDSIPDGVITTLPDDALPAGAASATARRNELRITGTVMPGPKPDRFVRLLAGAVEFGFSAVEVGNYGLMPADALTAVKQAIRFAKRSAP